MSDKLDEILTNDEVAAYLTEGKHAVCRLESNGSVPAFKLGGTWRFCQAELEQWISSQLGEVTDSADEGGAR
jgi:excisionase family DNA binding protein